MDEIDRTCDLIYKALCSSIWSGDGLVGFRAKTAEEIDSLLRNLSRAIISETKRQMLDDLRKLSQH